jgi:hypothetical protein
LHVGCGCRSGKLGIRGGIAENARGIHHALGGKAFDGVYAVEDVNVVFAAHAFGALAPFSAAGREVDAGAQFKKLREIAALNGQIADQLITDGAAQNGAGGFHERESFRYRDLLGLLAGLEREVDAILLVDFDADVLFALWP